MQHTDPADANARRAAGDDGDLDDLPNVPDVPDDPPGGDDAPMGSDDEAIRKIRRRISPMGWLAIIAVLGVGGGAGFQLYKTAVEESRETDDLQRGREELNQILQRNLPGPETARLVRELYQRYPSKAVHQAARRILAGLRDAESVPLLIEGLSDPGIPRAQAALGLAEIGLPAAESARQRLLDVLPQTQETTDRVEVAWALVVLNEPRAWPTVRELLENNKLQTVMNLNQRRIFDPALVARMAGRERLHELAISRAAGSKRLAALSLAEIASPEVLDDLSLLSRDSDRAVAREAAIGLGRTGDPRATAPIMAFLNGHADEREGVLGALASSSGAQGLAVVIHGSTDLQTRAAATRLLRDQRDPDAGDALFEALQAATGTDDVSLQMKRNAVFGLAEIGDARAVDGLMSYATWALTHFDTNATAEAKQSLELIRQIPGASQRAKEGLVAMVRDPHGDFVRTPAIVALARSGDPAVATQIQSFLTNPDAQEGAAVALCMLHHPDCFGRVLQQVKMPANLRMVEETVRDEAVLITRRTAIRALAWAAYTPPGVTATPIPAAGRVAAIRELRRIVEDPNDRRSLREEAGYSLAALADDAALQEIANRATDATVPEEARIFNIYALRGRCTPEIATRLVQTYLRRGVNPDVMRGAAVAAGLGANAATSDVLIPLVKTTDPQDATVRYAAAIAITLGGTAAAAHELLDVLLTNDELAGMMQNLFAPRAAGGGENNATVHENAELMPLTGVMFEDGRIYRRIEVAMLLEVGKNNHHYGWAQSQLIARLRGGWENAQGITATDVRARLRDAAMGTDAYRRDWAFKALRAMMDRGSLHALRRQTRNPEASERARRELLEMSGGPAGGAAPN